MGEIVTKTCFSPQCEPPTAKHSFSVFLKYFWGNLQRTSHFSQKSVITERSTEILRKFVLLFSEGNLDLFKQLFLIKSLKGEKY